MNLFLKYCFLVFELCVLHVLFSSFESTYTYGYALLISIEKKIMFLDSDFNYIKSVTFPSQPISCEFDLPLYVFNDEVFCCYFFCFCKGIPKWFLSVIIKFHLFRF